MKWFTVRDFPDEWHSKLKSEAHKRGLTIPQLLIDALGAYLGDKTRGQTEDKIYFKVKEAVMNDIKRNEDRPAGRKIWRTNICPKHGRWPINGRWVCCEK